MESVSLRLTNRDTMVDDVYAYVGRWAEENDRLDQGMLLRIALQEWISNLLLHADFGDQDVEIILDTSIDGGTVRCTVEDNSVGFDLDGEPSPSNGAESLGDRGRGLWIMREIANEGLLYEPIGNGRHKLIIAIGNNHDLWDDILSS